MDLGSQKTFILRDIAASLNLTVNCKVQLSINGFGSKLKPKCYDVVKFNVVSREEPVATEAVVVDYLPDSISMPGRSATVKSLQTFGFDLADDTVDTDTFTDIGLFIGANQYNKFVYCKEIRGVAIIPSKLRDLMCGSVSNDNSKRNHSNCVETVTVLCVGVTEEDLNSQLEKFWSLDSIGITYKSNNTDVDSLNDLKKCVSFEQGKYIANLPGKQNHPKLPNNFIMLKSRLISNLKSLRNNEDLLSQYDQIIKTQLLSGFIELVHEPEIALLICITSLIMVFFKIPEPFR